MILSFPRQIGLKRSMCHTESEFRNYVGKLNGKSSLYTSLYAFDRMNGHLPDYSTALIDRAWWDFDKDDNGNTIEKVKEDVAKLINRLEGDVRVVATGRGFHVHQLFARKVQGRNWAIHLDRYQRDMASGLSSLDGVGYPEKLTRVPDTYNPKRGRWCVMIDGRAFAQDPQNYAIPKRPQSRHKHLDPYFGDRPEMAFDLVKWVADNPDPKQDLIRTSTSVPNIEVGDNGIALPTCLEKAIRVSNPPHHVRVALVQEMARQLRWFADPEDVSEQQTETIISEICSFIKTLDWQDYNPHITRKGVATNVKYKNSPSPAWYRKHGLCDGNCWYCGES